MQVHPGAPGTARQGRTRIIVSTNDGGKATQPRAPGHGRPPAAQRAAGHGRLSAALRAPGADVPPATTVGAPGQYCLSAALQAPGHGRPLAITAGVPCRDRLSAAPIATVSLPAGLRRLCQGFLPRVPANPRTLIYPHSHHTTYQVHPAIHVPPHPRSCSTADTGFLRQNPSRAPPRRPRQPPRPSLALRPHSPRPRRLPALLPLPPCCLRCSQRRRSCGRCQRTIGNWTRRSAHSSLLLAPLRPRQEEERSWRPIRR